MHTLEIHQRSRDPYSYKQKKKQEKHQKPQIRILFLLDDGHQSLSSFLLGGTEGQVRTGFCISSYAIHFLCFLWPGDMKLCEY